MTVREAVFDDDILADAVTKTSQAFIESFHQINLLLLGSTPKVPHPIDPCCWLLSARRHGRRDRRAAEQCDELAPPHSITSSAKASRLAGIVMPNSLAVFRLITNSNLVGTQTGRSPALSPLRMRPA